MEEQREIQKQFRQGQEKYVYYIIALCVTAIGFSIHQTIGFSMKMTQIPLGIAVFSWIASVFYGLKFLEKRLNILYKNNVYFDLLQGRDDIAGNHPANIEIAGKVMKEIMQKEVVSASNYFNWQKRFSFLGFISFIIWHILEMYTKVI